MTTQATGEQASQATTLEGNPPRQQIEERAYYRYLDRGRIDGLALEDWLMAEAELDQRGGGVLDAFNTRTAAGE